MNRAFGPFIKLPRGFYCADKVEATAPHRKGPTFPPRRDVDDKPRGSQSRAYAHTLGTGTEPDRLQPGGAVAFASLSLVGVGVGSFTAGVSLRCACGAPRLPGRGGARRRPAAAVPCPLTGLRTARPQPSTC